MKDKIKQLELDMLRKHVVCVSVNNFFEAFNKLRDDAELVKLMDMLGQPAIIDNPPDSMKYFMVGKQS